MLRHCLEHPLSTQPGLSPASSVPLTQTNIHSSARWPRQLRSHFLCDILPQGDGHVGRRSQPGISQYLVTHGAMPPLFWQHDTAGCSSHVLEVCGMGLTPTHPRTMVAACEMEGNSEGMEPTVFKSIGLSASQAYEGPVGGSSEPQDWHTQAACALGWASRSRRGWAKSSQMHQSICRRGNGPLCYHVIFLRAQNAEKACQRGPCTAEPVTGRGLGPGVRVDGQRTWYGQSTKEWSLPPLDPSRQTGFSGICKKDLYCRTLHAGACRLQKELQHMPSGTAGGGEELSLDGGGLLTLNAAAHLLARGSAWQGDSLYTLPA